MEKFIRAAVSTAIAIPAFYLINDWKTFVGIFILLIGHNIERHS